MSLLSILMGIGIATTRALRDEWHLQAAVRQIVLDLRTARVAAIASSRARRLRFEVPGGAYHKEIESDRQTYAEIEAVELPAGIEITSCTGRNDAIGFRPRGNAGAFGTVRLADARGETRDIVVSFAGRVRVRR